MSAESDFRRAAARYRKAQAQLDEARAALHTAMTAGKNDGLTYEAMARELGVSRQRAMDILKRGAR